MARKKLTAAARRAQLIEVGRGVFAKKGFQATSVEEIAKRAKVSKPIVYEHFGGKEGLYAVVVDREVEHVVGLISAAIASGSPRERIEQVTLAFLTYVKDRPDGFAVLAQDAPITSNRGTFSTLLSDVAERVTVVVAVAFKDAGYDAKAAPIYAHALVGMVTFVGQWWTDAQKPSVDKVAKHVANLAWSGLEDVMV